MTVFTQSIFCLNSSSVTTYRNARLTPQSYKYLKPYGANLSIKYSRFNRQSSICFAIENSSNSSSEQSSTSLPVLEENVPILSENEQDEKDIADTLLVLDLLKKYRDMSFEEAKLTVMIEDPREAEKRRELGIENESGCSRDDIAEALTEVYNGEKPKDRLALRVLANEMRNWPNLTIGAVDEIKSNPFESPYAAVTDTGVDPTIAARRAKILTNKNSWDESIDDNKVEENIDISSNLPSWMGYGMLYGVSVIPIVIGIIVVVILFTNSLQ